MARKNNADTAKDKAARQKKIVIILAVVLVLAMVFAFHTMSSLGGAPAASKPQAVTGAPIQTATSPASTVTPVAPSLAGTPTVTTPAATDTSTTPAAGADSSQLIAVVIPTADPGQLDSFSQFESKDPFAAAGSATTSGGSSGTKGSAGSGKTPSVPPTPPSPPPTSAVISVNGSSETVQSGSDFPLANPVSTTNGLFQLVKLTAKTAIITVVGGSYASGSQTLTLSVNKPVTLVNTADGTRYTLILYPQGTTAPISSTGAATGSSTPTSTPATTPATTTPTTTTGG